jgi:hypothetical protein
MSNKISGIINTAIRSEQEYQEGRRADWMFTKKVMRQIDESKFSDGTTIYCGAGNVTIRVKWGVENLRSARQAMGDGWKFSSNYTSDNGTLTKSYYRYDPALPDDSFQRRGYCGLNLVMDATELNEDSCKKIEVGEKTYTQKIYKIVCDGKAEEILGEAKELDDQA